MIPVQKKTLSLAGMLPKSNNMITRSDINTADTNKVHHLLVVGADTLTMSEIMADSASVEKVSDYVREFLAVDGFLRSCSDSTKAFIHAYDVNEVNAIYRASGSSNSEFSESIKKSLPSCGNTVYGYRVPHRAGAGIGVLKILKTAYDAPSVFFLCRRSDSPISWALMYNPAPLSVSGGLGGGFFESAGVLQSRLHQPYLGYHQRNWRFRW